MPSWRRGQRPSKNDAGYMRAVVPLAAISTHCPCKAGWVHIGDTLSEQGCVYGQKSGVACAQQSATEQSWQTLWRGDVLPLDKSRLMGV